MNLDNQWVDLSKQRLITTSNILASEYKTMTETAFVIYDEKNAKYHSFVEAGEDGFEASDQMATLVDYAKAFGKASIMFYKNTLIRAAEIGVADPMVNETELDLLKNCLHLQSDGRFFFHPIV